LLADRLSYYGADRRWRHRVHEGARQSLWRSRSKPPAGTRHSLASPRIALRRLVLPCVALHRLSFPYVEGDMEAVEGDMEDDEGDMGDEEALRALRELAGIEPWRLREV
jgi:hypothetical protein